jgi:hypothetical protein
MFPRSLGDARVIGYIRFFAGSVWMESRAFKRRAIMNRLLVLPTSRTCGQIEFCVRAGSDDAAAGRKEKSKQYRSSCASRPFLSAATRPASPTSPSPPYHTARQPQGLRSQSRGVQRRPAPIPNPTHPPSTLPTARMYFR